MSVRVTLGVTATLAGVLATVAACNTAPNHALMGIAVALLVTGLMILAPSDAQVQARVRHQVRIAHRPSFGVGFESNGADYRL